MIPPCFASALLLFCSLFQQPAPQEAPARAKAAIEKTRGQESVRTGFEARIEAPNSDPMDIKGDSLQIAGGVLFISYRASGGDLRRIIRAGDEVWTYHELAEQWVTAASVGMSGAARGVQNPDEVLSVLAGHLGSAAFGKSETVNGKACEAVRLKLTGDDIEKIMKEQAQEGAFDWKRSSADGTLFVGPDGLIARISSRADLVSADPSLRGQTVKYAAEVTVAGVNDFAGLEAAPLVSPAIFAAIEKRPGVPKKLVDELARLRDAALEKHAADLASKDSRVREGAESELLSWGKAAVPALTKAAADPARAEAARKLLDQIRK